MGKQTLKAKEVYRLRISAYKRAWLGASVIVESENARKQVHKNHRLPTHRARGKRCFSCVGIKLLFSR